MFSTVSGELKYDPRVLYRETRRIPRTLHIEKKLWKNFKKWNVILFVLNNIDHIYQDLWSFDCNMVSMKIILPLPKVKIIFWNSTFHILGHYWEHIQYIIYLISEFKNNMLFYICKISIGVLSVRVKHTYYLFIKFFICYRWILRWTRYVLWWTRRRTSEICPSLRMLIMESQLWQTPLCPRPVLLLVLKLVRPGLQILARMSRNVVLLLNPRKFNLISYYFQLLQCK